MKWTMLAAFALALTARTSPAEVPNVVCPDRAPRHTEVAYHEVWRVGADDEEVVFGAIQDAAADDAGNVYLLDMQLQSVFKFSAAGEFLGVIVRKGEGPGEIDGVYSLEMIGTDSLGLVKGFPGQIVVVALDGTPRPSLVPKAPALEVAAAFTLLDRVECRDGFVACQGHVSHASGKAHDGTDYLASLGADGSVRHCYGTRRGGYDFSRPITVDEAGDRFAYINWALGRQGEIYLAPDRDRWLIEVRDPEGRLLRTITRQWQPHRRTSEEKEAAKQQFAFTGTELPPIKYRIADTDAVIAGLQFVGDELRVHATGEPKSAAPVGPGDFEVFDVEGRLVESRTLKVPDRRPTDHMIFLDDGRLVCVRGLYAAVMAMQAGVNVQVGDKLQDGSEVADVDVLEVIVYAPDSK